MLSEQRTKIDQLDRQIVSLLEERMGVVSKIAQIKADNQLAIFDDQRELAVLDKIRGYVKEETYEASIVELYQEMMAISKRYQRKAHGK